MAWRLLGDLQVLYEEQTIPISISGNSIIKIEHDFPAGIFPGIGYAVVREMLPGGEVFNFIKSYPYRGPPRVYDLSLSAAMQAAGFGTRTLTVTRGKKTAVQADSAWRMMIYEWI